MTATFAALVAFGVSCATEPVVMTLLRRHRVLDHPSERSSHSRPVPRGGGIGLAVGALAALGVSVPHLDYVLGLIVAVASFGLLGLLEDLVGVRALRRLAVQLVLAASACLLLLKDLSGPPAWRILFAAAIVLWLVGFVNAFNFMDGIDGISVAQAVGAGATWFVVGRVVGVPMLTYGGSIVAGAALGFAPFNLPRAKMFLGDVGSYFLGAWLATVALLGLRAGVPPEAVLAPLALYVTDTGVTLARRVARGEPWHSPHRDHVYQRLTDSGYPHMAVAALVAGCVAACGALGVVSLEDSVPARAAADVAIVAIIGTYLLSPRWLARRGSTVAVG